MAVYMKVPACVVIATACVFSVNATMPSCAWRMFPCLGTWEAQGQLKYCSHAPIHAKEPVTNVIQMVHVYLDQRRMCSRRCQPHHWGHMVTLSTYVFHCLLTLDEWRWSIIPRMVPRRNSSHDDMWFLLLSIPRTSKMHESFDANTIVSCLLCSPLLRTDLENGAKKISDQTADYIRGGFIYGWHSCSY